MTAVLNEQSRLTDRYQTTIPKGVRTSLGLKKGDRIGYVVERSGRVYLEPDRPNEDDPALGGFLDLLEADIAANPDKLAAFSGGLRDRMQALVGDVEVDLDAPLSPNDE